MISAGAASPDEASTGSGFHAGERLKLGRCMRKKWSTLCIAYLASLSPACLARNVLTAGDPRN